MAINQEETLSVRTVINCMVKLTKVVEKKEGNHRENKNGSNTKGFWRKERSNTHNHLAKGDDDKEGDALD